jgi:transcriptional regulator with XRE-family HTH domain
MKMNDNKRAGALEDLIIGQKIYQLRISKGITASGLAAILGVSVQQLNKYEKGINRISLKSFLAFSQILRPNKMLAIFEDIMNDVTDKNVNPESIMAQMESIPVKVAQKLVRMKIKKCQKAIIDLINAIDNSHMNIETDDVVMESEGV